MQCIYDILYRFDYLKSKPKRIKIKNYMQKFEVSRRTFFRDLQHLQLIYDITYVYDKVEKVWILVE